MIKVDKDKLEVNGIGLILLGELTLAINHIAEALGMSHKDILTVIDRAIDHALDEGIKNDANLS